MLWCIKSLIISLKLFLSIATPNPTKSSMLVLKLSAGLNTQLSSNTLLPPTIEQVYVKQQRLLSDSIESMFQRGQILTTHVSSVSSAGNEIDAIHQISTATEKIDTSTKFGPQSTIVTTTTTQGQFVFSSSGTSVVQFSYCFFFIASYRGRFVL